MYVLLLTAARTCCLGGPRMCPRPRPCVAVAARCSLLPPACLLASSSLSSTGRHPRPPPRLNAAVPTPSPVLPRRTTPTSSPPSVYLRPSPSTRLHNDRLNVSLFLSPLMPWSRSPRPTSTYPRMASPLLSLRRVPLAVRKRPRSPPRAPAVLVAVPGPRPPPRTAPGPCAPLTPPGRAPAPPCAARPPPCDVRGRPHERPLHYAVRRPRPPRSGPRPRPRLR